MKITTLTCLLLIGATSITQAQKKTKNVVLVTLDGFRWQELYKGAQDDLLNNPKYTSDKESLEKKYVAQTPQERRKKLLPFFWSTIATKGQLLGNRDLNHKFELANTYRFSYPGYNELLAGYFDPAVNSNDKNLNKNMTVLNFINDQEAFKNKVVSFSSWDVIPYVVNMPEAQGRVNGGMQNYTGPTSPELAMLNSMQFLMPPLVGDDVRLDAVTYQLAKEYMRAHKSRLTYISLDETDDTAHGGNYKFYLEQAHKADAMLADLWKYIQNDPFYKDQTTLIITCDHGRGDVAYNSSWTDHGDKVKGAEETWLAIIGPDTPALGELSNSTQTAQTAQVAATVADLLGFSFDEKAAKHPVAPPMKELYR
ncbi:MAG: alkaline phosphatase family protein [Sphingobacteriaceae bacterium]|nr:alkaline phosphatase family protein [Sphingobacteriaceae bacterium]